MSFGGRFDKELAMRDWQNVKSDEDMVLWHKMYTPWWPMKEVVEVLLPLYQKRRENPDKDEMLNLSEFDKLRLKSI